MGYKQLEEAEDDRFPAMLAGQMSLWAKTISVAAQRVVFVVEASNDFSEERVGVVPNQHIFDSECAHQLTAAQLVAILLNAPNLRDYLLREGKPEHVWFQIQWETLGTPAMYLQKLQPLMLRRISKVIIEGPCSLTLNGLRLRRGKIGSTQLAWGKTVILGRDATVVATRDAGGLEKMSINVSAASLKNSIPPAADGLEGSQAGYCR